MRLSQRLALKYIRTKFKVISLISKRKAAEAAFRLFCTPQYRNRKKLPGVFEDAEKINLVFQGFRIAGYRWNASSEKKLLILHGFESSVINFDRYVKPLVKKGYCVLAFDAPAHGRSSGTRINVLLYRDLINQICHQFGPVKHFLAHSLGGLALSLTLEEWTHDESSKVVLIAPATETSSAIDSYFDFLKLDPSLRDEFEKVILRLGGQHASWFSIARASAHVRAQVLWVHDQDDDMTPLSDVERIMEKEYPNFRFMITEGLGHRRIYRDNKVAHSIIEFF